MNYEEFCVYCHYDSKLNHKLFLNDSCMLFFSTCHEVCIGFINILLNLWLTKSHFFPLHNYLIFFLYFFGYFALGDFYNKIIASRSSAVF